MKQSKLSFGAPSSTKKEVSNKMEKKLVDPLQFFSKKISQKPPVVLKTSSFFNDTEIDHVLMAQGDVLEAALEPMDVSDENNPLVDNVSVTMNGPKEEANDDSLKEGKDGPKERNERKEEPRDGNEEPKKKFNYYAHKQKLAQMPKAHGSKEIPVGEDNCLGGLAFVFTGELESLTREEAMDLVKRYGARVVGAPSSKTSFVVVGEEAGASKLEKVKKLGLKTLNEDGLFDLIRDSKSRPEEVQKPGKKSPKKSPVKTQQEPVQMAPKYTIESIKRDNVDVYSLSVKNIKEILMENNISTTGLVEKSDLVSKVYSLMGNGDLSKKSDIISLEMIKEGKVEVNSLSVSSLKDILERNNVSTIGLLEKSDLRNAIKELSSKFIPRKNKIFDFPMDTMSKKVKIDHENVSNSAVDDQLWTVKYKPKSYSDIIGNKTLLDKLSKWLREWHQNRLNDFKKRDETSIWRAALLSGPPGIGKTTMAHLVAQTEGYDPLEFNASDVRSKKALENVVKDALGTKSVTEFFPVIGQGQAKNKKTVIIMDEVDGMSAGDRGGSAELIRLIKKSKVPIICICNDRKSPKMRSLANSCLDLSLRRPTAQQVENRIKMIALKEGLDLKANVVGELVASTCADIRQILNILSTYRLSKNVMTYDQSKSISMNAKKNITVGPFDVMSKIFSQSGFRSMSLPEKIEQYFHDYSLIPLMIQENYIRMSPSLAREASKNNSKQMEFETLSLISNAADAISLGDVLDNSQRSANNWSLLPVHAVFSTVIPCFYTHGQMNGMFNFPSWLGQNSKSSKTLRLLREIATHTRINVSADKLEFRDQYVPALVSRMFDPISKKGQDGINEVISFMDHYHITKDDFDCINEIFMKKLPDIPTSVKSAFTRTYNKMAHPTVSANSISTLGGGRADNVRPDFDDILEDDDGPDDGPDEEEGEEDKLDDKMIKVSKKKEKAKESKGKTKAKKDKK